MSSRLALLKPLVATLMLVAAGASQATLTVFTSLAGFTAATTEQGTDTFTGLALGPAFSPLARTTTAGTVYDYSAAVPAGGLLFGVGTPADPALSPSTSLQAVTFSGFAPLINAIGGNFFVTDRDGQVQLGDVVVTAQDASGSVTETIVSATPDSFLGFVSSSTIVSLVVSSVQPAAGALWPTIDNLVLARTPSIHVPEPATGVLLMAALCAGGLLARRGRGA